MYINLLATTIKKKSVRYGFFFSRLSQLYEVFKIYYFVIKVAVLDIQKGQYLNLARFFFASDIFAVDHIDLTPTKGRKGGVETGGGGTPRTRACWAKQGQQEARPGKKSVKNKRRQISRKWKKCHATHEGGKRQQQSWCCCHCRCRWHRYRYLEEGCWQRCRCRSLVLAGNCRGALVNCSMHQRNWRCQVKSVRLSAPRKGPFFERQHLDSEYGCRIVLNSGRDLLAKW